MSQGVGRMFCLPKTAWPPTLKADKAVDLSKVKAGDKVAITVDKDTLTSVKPAAKPKAAVGC